MGFLDSLMTYAGKWSVKSSRNISASEASEISSATVKSSDYGLSLCMTMHKGGQKYVPISRDSSLAEGDKVDVNSINIITLEKDGEDDIMRVDAVAL